MLSSNDVLGYVRAAPFRPFRIQMSGGRTFDIRHPEMVRVGTTNLMIFSLVSEDPAIHDRWSTVSLFLIESLSHLETPAA